MDSLNHNPLRAVPPAATSRALSAPPLHVLEVVGNAIVGGMERCVERLVAGLGRGGAFRFTVAIPSEGEFADRLRASGADVVVVAMPEDPSWTSVQMLSALITAEGIELVHAHMPNAHVLSGLAARLADVPLMTTIHARQVILADFEVHRQVGSHISVVCWQSYYHALGLGIPRSRLSCEPNGVDIDQFCPGPRPGEGLRSSLGIGPLSPVLGFLGRLSPEKAPDVFVRGAASLLRRMPEAHAVLVGDGPMKTALRDSIAALGMGDRLHVLDGVDDVRPVLHDLDVLALTSHTEAMPLALMEAMASGLPVVATRVGGVPEIVAHGTTGWLIAPHDHEDLAGRAFQLLTQPELRQRMGLAARERMRRRHRLDRALDRLADRMHTIARPGAVATETLNLTAQRRSAEMEQS